MESINRHNCLNCAVKHLASAAAIAREMLTGYDTPEYRLYLLGNLNEAQEQLTGIDVELANLVRQVRLWIAPDRLEITITQEKLQAIETLGKVVAKRPASLPAPMAGEPAAPTAIPPCRCSESGSSAATPWKSPGRKFQPGGRFRVRSTSSFLCGPTVRHRRTTNCASPCVRSRNISATTATST